MGAPKGRPKPEGSGRQVGTPNRTTRAAKQAIEQAAEELGGVARLVAWVREDPANERVFWGTIYPKLLPLQLSGSEDSAFPTVTRIELVALTPE